MLPQMRQIQRFVVDEQSTQEERVGVDGLAKGIGRAERVVLDDVGCDERRVWEYRQTGQLWDYHCETIEDYNSRTVITGCLPICLNTCNEKCANKAP
jgi:hypothetical protein